MRSPRDKNEGAIRSGAGEREREPAEQVTPDPSDDCYYYGGI